jgi:hypothetical protein
MNLKMNLAPQPPLENQTFAALKKKSRSVIVQNPITCLDEEN